MEYDSKKIRGKHRICLLFLLPSLYTFYNKRDLRVGIKICLKDNKNLVASVYECMDAIHEKMNYKCLGWVISEKKYKESFIRIMTNM